MKTEKDSLSKKEEESEAKLARLQEALDHEAKLLQENKADSDKLVKKLKTANEKKVAVGTEKILKHTGFVRQNDEKQKGRKS